MFLEDFLNCGLSLTHTVQELFEKLGSKMDYRVGFSVVALTVASTAAFVKCESSNLREGMTHDEKPEGRHTKA